MKKIMLFTLLMLFASASYSQVFYARAQSLKYGSIEQNQFTTLYESPVDVLVRGDKLSLTIYSKDLQEYIIMNYMGKDKKVDSWTVVDRKGNVAILHIIVPNEEDNVIVIGIEYDDVAWIYTCLLEKIQ
jgi:hypothetical protein